MFSSIFIPQVNIAVMLPDNSPRAETERLHAWDGSCALKTPLLVTVEGWGCCGEGQGGWEVVVVVSQGLVMLQDSFGTEVSAPGHKEQANKGLGGGGPADVICRWLLR